MQLENQTDHIAILALMIAGVLIRRLHEAGQLDKATERQLYTLVEGVRSHAKHAGLGDLNILFDNVERALSDRGAGH